MKAPMYSWHPCVVCYYCQDYHFGFLLAKKKGRPLFGYPIAIWSVSLNYMWRLWKPILRVVKKALILSIFRKVLWNQDVGYVWFVWVYYYYYFYFFLGYSVMGKPFWGRAKGPYWIPFIASTTDHLHQKNRTNTL